MKRPKTGSTLKQYAYATKKLNGGEGAASKKDIARSVGYSPAVANNVANKIESTEGYHNAVIELAHESNNMMLAIFHEYKARGLEGFSDKDLNGALNAISSAWEKFDKRRAPDKSQDSNENPLKKVMLTRIENQTIINNPPATVVEANATEDDPNDF